MLTLAEIKGRLRAGQYAWPGGYPLYFICEDGEALSYASVRENWREIVSAHITVAKCPSARRNYSQWLLAACDINWEDAELVCAHSGKPIESAYGET